MPLIMPPHFDAVPAIIQIAAHKPATHTPARPPAKPADTPPPPGGSQGPLIVGPAPVTLPPPPPPPAPSS